MFRDTISCNRRQLKCKRLICVCTLFNNLFLNWMLCLYHENKVQPCSLNSSILIRISSTVHPMWSAKQSMHINSVIFRPKSFLQTAISSLDSCLLQNLHTLLSIIFINPYLWYIFSHEFAVYYPQLRFYYSPHLHCRHQTIFLKLSNIYIFRSSHVWH